MTFEKALEAMKQGKKAGRRAWADWDKSKMIFLKGDYFYWVGEEDIGVALTLDFLEADDWEIYEEPNQSEHEMTAEKAVEILRTVRKMETHAYSYGLSISGFRKAIYFAIEALENQNQPELTGKDIQKIAFDKFTAGLKCGLEIAEDLQKENVANA